MVLLLLAASAAQTAWAQSFSVLHSFDGEAGGEYPYAGVTIGPRGNLYGTTTNSLGGNVAGIVYQLEHRDSGWVFNVLYTFRSYNAGRPFAGVVFGPQSVLYGTTYGTVYSLRPLAAIPIARPMQLVAAAQKKPPQHGRWTPRYAKRSLITARVHGRR